MTDSPAASAVEDLTAIPEFLDRRVEDGSTVASQPGMFEPLSPDEKAEAASASSRASSPAAESAPIVPVPDDAPPMRFRHPVHGEPSMTWPYHDADSGLVGYICRWDYTNAEGKPAKDYLPITYCDLGDGRQEWRAVGFPTLRPLYRLPKILARPDAPVLICEGEKTADAAAKLFPEMVATTPPHGAQSPHKADYTPLAGSQVLIWPDADQPGAWLCPRRCTTRQGRRSGFCGHSGRAGGWRAPVMVARYSERLTARRGAAAKLARLQGRG